MGRMYTVIKAAMAGALGVLGPLTVPSCAVGPAGDAPVYSFEVVATYPHDTKAFTQGLFYQDGVLYESTGQYGESSLRRVDLETGEVLARADLEARYFGEGIAPYRDGIVMLTWRSQTGFVYDRDTFERLRTFRYSGEGWGLTFDGAHLIMSDGTSTLRFLDPETFEETRRLTVRDARGPVGNLNELEYIDGKVYANIWRTDRLAIISPQTGEVTAWVDLRGLLPPALRAGADVLNGIAYDAEGDRLFVTGKLWPTLYEIRLVAPRADAH